MVVSWIKAWFSYQKMPNSNPEHERIGQRVFNSSQIKAIALSSEEHFQLEHFGNIGDKSPTSAGRIPVGYGLRSGRSTGDLVTLLTNRWTEAVEIKGKPLAVSLYVAKAFNRVWRKAASLEAFILRAS
ncbi:hypothetical protein EVAR_50950_1 [Eumeta japonica]|uniref:Uncharacterized protein n=1 Tax=Eumeta variegata TaxID=151549 RepID=A0A4C1X9Z3_EUMVA|nr:hypothetical protein EVAR_50950_1 [Eumeta japonica]